MHSQALRHYLTVLTQSLSGGNKSADKSALTTNDLKRDKHADSKLKMAIQQNVST
jgi:hypothetical protein